MDPKQIDVEMLMREADKRGNQQIDFDEVILFYCKKFFSAVYLVLRSNEDNK